MKSADDLRALAKVHADRREKAMREAVIWAAADIVNQVTELAYSMASREDITEFSQMYEARIAEDSENEALDIWQYSGEFVQLPKDLLKIAIKERLEQLKFKVSIVEEVVTIAW